MEKVCSQDMDRMLQAMLRMYDRNRERALPQMKGYII